MGPFDNRAHEAELDWYPEIRSDTGINKLWGLGMKLAGILEMEKTGIAIAGKRAFLFDAFEMFKIEC